MKPKNERFINAEITTFISELLYEPIERSLVITCFCLFDGRPVRKHFVFKNNLFNIRECHCTAFDGVGVVRQVER